MSRDMCRHGFDLREQLCDECSPKSQLLDEARDEIADLRTEAAKRDAELSTLRLIVTEKSTHGLTR